MSLVFQTKRMTSSCRLCYGTDYIVNFLHHSVPESLSTPQKPQNGKSEIVGCP